MADTLAHNTKTAAPSAVEQRIIVRAVRDIVGTPDYRIIIFVTPQNSHITHIAVDILAQDIFTAAGLIDTFIGNRSFENETAAQIV